MPKRSGHENSVSKVCVFCFYHTKEMRLLRDPQMVKLVIPTYDELNPVFPKVCCMTCYKRLTNFPELSPDTEKHGRLERLYHTRDIWKNITKNLHFTCSEDCIVCLHLKSFSNNFKLPSELVEKFKAFDPPAKTKQKKITEKLCRVCLTVLHPGKRHICTTRTLTA